MEFCSPAGARYILHVNRMVWPHVWHISNCSAPPRSPSADSSGLPPVSSIDPPQALISHKHWPVISGDTTAQPQPAKIWPQSAVVRATCSCLALEVQPMRCSFFVIVEKTDWRIQTVAPHFLRSHRRARTSRKCTQINIPTHCILNVWFHFVSFASLKPASCLGFKKWWCGF